MDIEQAIQYALNKNGYMQLLPNQRSVIEQYLKGRDVLFCSPTGSGKSLVFEMAPFLFQYLEKKHDCTCIIISPLTALMKSQVEKLSIKNIKAVYLRDREKPKDNEADRFWENIENGHFELIFASPETLLQSYRSTVMQLAKRNHLKVIFVDEAHCIKKLGKTAEKSKSPAYRPMYGCLGEIRSLVGPKIPVVALTATASTRVADIILKDLCMTETVFKLTVNPNKENIKYWVFETSRGRGDIGKDFDWLTDMLRREGIKMPRMIIFFRKIDHIADVFEHLETSLGDATFVLNSNNERQRIFEMYHLKTDEEVKESIAESYQDRNGSIRVVLCSTSFSMGLDVKGVNTVVHYGACNDLDDYLQESGRAGRQPDEKCHAIVMKYKQCLGSRNITQDMKAFITTKACRRQLLLKPFTDTNPKTGNHDCCDNCAAKCSCQCTCGDHDCICDERCNHNVSQIYEMMQVFLHKDIDTESSDACSEGYDSNSEIEQYRSRKPQVLESSSDED